MIKDIKMIIDGTEVPLPFDLNEIISQLRREHQQEEIPPEKEVTQEREMPFGKIIQRILMQQSQIPQSQMPQPYTPQIPTQHQTMKKTIICRCHDLDARKAIFGMDKRVTILEDALKEILQEKQKAITEEESKPKPIRKNPIIKKSVITKEKLSDDKKPLKKKIVNTPKLKSTSNTNKKSKK